MKKRFTRILAALALLLFVAPPMMGWAADETITFSQMGLENAVQYTTIQGTDCTLTFGDGGNDGKYYNTGAAIRVYAGGHMTVSAMNSKTIEKIELTFGSGDGSNTITTDVTTYSNGTWQGSAQSSVTFNVGGTSGHRRIASVAITYSTGGSQTNTCTVTYKANGPEVDDVVETYNEGATVNLKPANTFTYDGYTFSGWNTQADGDGDAYEAEGTIENIQDDIELYAIWTENSTSGTNVTFVAGTDTGTTTENNSPDQVVKDGITMYGSDAAFATAQYRYYANSTTTFTSAVGNITKIVFTQAGNYPISRFSVANGSTGTYNSQTGTWTGNAASVSFSASGQVRASQVVVTIEPNDTPAIIANPSTLSTFSYLSTSTDPSAAQQVTVSGANLTAGITVSVGANSAFEMCTTENGDYSNSDITLPQTNGAVAATSIYVRMKANQTGNPTGTLSLTSAGATAVNIDLNGSVVTPMTVAEAIAAIAEASGNTVDDAYVSGIVCQIDEYDSSHNSITYWISDDGTTTTKLEVYSGKGLNGANFTSVDDLTVGDEVVVFGDLKMFGEVYEFNYNNYLVSWVHNDIPVINPLVTTLNMDYNLTIGEIGYTITNEVSGMSLSATADASWIYNINVASDKVTFHTSQNDGQESRTATITLSYEGAVDKTVTITQGVCTPSAAGAEWVLTDLADLTANDVFVIVGTIPEGSTDDVLTFAMPHSNGSSSAPVVVEVTIENSKITSTVDASIQWNISGDATNGYSFYPNSDSEKWLYCTNSNDGVRVGTNTNNEFTYVNTYDEQHPDQGYYLFNTATSRYVGIYITSNGSGHAQDWRCYDAAYNNIKNQSFAFYKKVDAQPESHTKTIQPYTANAEQPDRYYLIASPVECAEPSAANGFLTNDYDLYRFDQAQELEWLNYEVTPFNLLSGHGYLYANSGNGTDPTVTLTFTGTPYSGNGQVTLRKVDGASWEGWNLIGNPYATAATPNKSFYRMNDDGSGLKSNTETGSVNPMEGIFVVAETDGETVTFTQGTAKSVEQVVVNLTRNRGNVIDNAIVRFDEGSQLPKFQLFENSTKLYIPQGNKDYAVVRSAAEAEMPVSFRASENGTYTLAVEAENVEMNYLHLIDNLTGMDVDLLQTPSYTFEATTRDYESRFRLVFAGNNANADSDNFAFFSNGNLIINNDGNATLQVIDLTGRILSSENVNGSVSTTLNATPGVYMLRLINGENVKVQKVVVR